MAEVEVFEIYRLRPAWPCQSSCIFARTT